MISNLDLILPLLKFESEDDFYYLQILQRKKENETLNSNSRVIKNYYISSNGYLLDRYIEITKLCTLFNARAMIRLNKRSYSKVAFRTIQKLANNLANGEHKFCRKSYDKAVGQGHNDKNKKWFIDIDNNELVDSVRDVLFLSTLQPISNQSKLITQLRSKSGTHLITSPFNISQFKEDYKTIYDMDFECDIQKDNPTNLFIP